ncbi:integral membrane protein [Colletotrichum orchidophilum]|uniref:Integral membrane protein n=1 Tax=Colletotrichum orchidophilum TaxID=1209926 RepID=A0A1G4AXQ8_9PEZI|nr:uncharacterized protein CORC01_10805 [Colletotrichum orchidophilum]OHE93906.1 integral membrane protein [Colletotrichum orchidophilum]
MEAATCGANARTTQPWLVAAISLTFGIGGAIALLTLVARLAIRHSQKALKCDDFVARSARPDLTYVAEVARLLSHGLAETSLVLLYLRIFPSKWQTRAGRAMLAVISAYTIAISGLLIHRASACAYPEPIRTDEGAAGALQLPVAATGAGIMTGCLLVLLPLPDLFRVRLKPVETRRVILLWCSPVVGIAVSSVRLFFLCSLPGRSDPAMYAALAMVFMSAETNLTVICGNSPAMLQITRKLRAKATSWATTAASGSREGGCSGDRPGGQGDYPLHPLDRAERPWTTDDDDSSQRGILQTATLPV